MLKSIPPMLGRAGAVAALCGLAACATPPPQATTGGAPGPSVNVNEPVKVGLLVPLGSGDPARDAIANSLVNAARLAQADLQGAAIDLTVYETGGTASGGASAASRAVAEGAQALIGPLFSPATAGAQPIANAAGLPVLSLSNNASVAGGNVFLLGLTFENTADRLVSYARARGLGNIAVVYARGLEGETARDAVEAAVQRHGATLVAAEAYDLSVQGIQSAAGPIAERLLGAGANAVILTDGPTGGLGLISSSLREFGLASGTAQFLGMQRWDVSAEALAEPSLQGGWFAAPDPRLLSAFEGRYQAAYGERPHELAGLAYDGVAAIGALIRDARARGSSNPFAAERLTQGAGFAGVNGTFRFTPDGLNQRNLAIMEVRGGSAIILDPAARSFGAVGF